jgi:hypothetical protein
LWQQKQQENQKPPISICQQLEMSKERFLREFQHRTKGYTDKNGRDCLFKDSVEIETALAKIYQRSFQSQEYFEIINATSSVIYPEIFRKTFSNNSDLRNFFVIGIIGEQSGGKSFLINKVFGTKIAESKFKCTTGILATRVNVAGHDDVKSIVILDTEGLLDRSKKNADALIFDRKIVLEVMARSHVVLINITRNVNKTMQQILEIVLYGLNKLQIANKPKVIFLFRDQDPKTMDDSGQLDHVHEVMDDIKKACGNVKFDVQKIINGFYVHEFPSPFVDICIGERKMSFFSDSFCQKALQLRVKVIDQLANLTPFDSFSEWVANTLELWQEINHNSNLFDFQSLVHLTLEKALQEFCNRVLADANSRMLKMVNDKLNMLEKSKLDTNKILHEIKQQLAEMRRILVDDLLKIHLTDEKKRLLKTHNLESFPEMLLDSTTSRIKTSLHWHDKSNKMISKRDLPQCQKNYPQKSEKQKMFLRIPLNSRSYLRQLV